MEYIIQFNEEALAAGFENSSIYTVLPEDDYITVHVEQVIPPGIYIGNILVRQLGDETTLDAFPFQITVIESAKIIKQPESVAGLCEGDAFRLSVEATGINLSYQWFLNDKIIDGATLDTYEAPIAEKITGQYHVEIYSKCGMVVSKKVDVSINSFNVLVKWNDMLYVPTTDNTFTAYQWYKNGQPITQHGTSVYYPIDENTEGTYYVRAYYTNDRYIESCEITLSSSSSFMVYPTVVQQWSNLSIESKSLDGNLNGAQIDLYDLKGKLIYKAKATGSRVEVPMTISTGAYILHITTLNGKKTVEKIFVK